MKMKSLYLILIAVVLLAGCTANNSESKTPPTINKEPTEVYRFNSSVIPKEGESVYYVVTGETNGNTTIDIKYSNVFTFDSLIGSRPWTVGQKCIAWDASYVWMYANIKTESYTVRLVARDYTQVTVSDVLVTKNKAEFDNYKGNNC